MIEIVAVFLILPAVAALLSVGVRRFLPERVAYLFPAVPALFLFYVVGTLVLAWPEGMRYSPILGLDLGESPVLLILFIMAGIGALAGSVMEPVYRRVKSRD